MRTIFALLVITVFAFGALAFAEEQTTWSAGGTVTNVKEYDAKESHGYVLRIDMKCTDGKDKNLYTNKLTAYEDANGNKKGPKAVKVGGELTVSYQVDPKAKDNFVAYKVVIK